MSTWIVLLRNISAATVLLAGGVSLNLADARPVQMQIDQKEAEAGRAAAQKDISNQFIRYDIVGQPSMIDSELMRLATAKYNITVTFHGCCAGPRIDYNRAYLDVVIAHLKALHGFDPVPMLKKELRAKQK